MDNAADALKMAGSILIWIVALSIVILFFSQIRQTSDTIINYKDRESSYMEEDYYKGSGSVDIPPNSIAQPARIVGIETIMQTMTRAYLENYKIFFYDSSNQPMVLFKVENRNDNSGWTGINYIDADDTNEINISLGDTSEKKDFLKALLYHKFNPGITKTQYERNKHIKLNDENLFDSIKDKKFYEFFGLYYQNDSENVPQIMKIEKRIITYKEVN